MLLVDRGDLDGLKIFITAAGKKMFTFMSVSMEVMFEHFKAEDTQKKFVCSTAAGTLSNIRKELHILRSKVCSDTLAMNKSFGTFLEQAVKKWKALSKETKRKSENTAVLKNMVIVLRENHRDVSKNTRQAFDEVCYKNAVDCQKIVSAMIIESDLHEELAKKANLCARELERSQLMCQQYKELFEQEQNKVFELLAEKEACWHNS